MAWGDLHYDHSDIFNPPPGEKARRERELLKTELDRTVRPGHPHWEAILRVCREGASVARVGAVLNHKNPRGSTARLLTRMLKAGVLLRKKETTHSRGQNPYVYYTVRTGKEGQRDG